MYFTPSLPLSIYHCDDTRERSYCIQTYQICSTALDTVHDRCHHIVYYTTYSAVASVFLPVAVRWNAASWWYSWRRMEKLGDTHTSNTLTKRYEHRYSLDHIIIILYARYDDCWQSKHILTHLILLMCVLFHFNIQVYVCLCLCLSLPRAFFTLFPLFRSL